MGCAASAQYAHVGLRWAGEAADEAEGRVKFCGESVGLRRVLKASACATEPPKSREFVNGIWQHLISEAHVRTGKLIQPERVLTLGILCTRCGLATSGERTPTIRLCTTVNRLPAESRKKQVPERPSISHGLESSEFELGTTTAELWNLRQVFHVQFLNGDPIVQRRVTESGSEWTRYANIHFDFGQHSDIRISFEAKG